MNKDMLYRCLEAYCYLEEESFPGESICSGIQLKNGKIEIDDFPVVADRIGLKAEIKQGGYSALKNIDRPTIILTKENKALLIVSADFKREFLVVFDPESEEIKTKKVSLNEIKKIISDRLISISKKSEVEERTNEFISDSNKINWFKETLNKIRKKYPIVILGSVFINLLVFVVPLFVMNVYDRVIPNDDTNILWAFSIAAITFILFDLLLKITRGFILAGETIGINIELENKLFQHSLNLRLGSSFQNMSSYVNISKQLSTVRQFYTSVTLATVVDFPFMLLYLIVIGLLGGKLVIVPIVCLIIMILLNLSFQPFISRAIKTELQTGNQRESIFIEALTSIEIIKSLAAEKIFTKRYENSAKIYDGNNHLIFLQISQNLSQWLTQSFTIFLIIYGAYLIADNKLTVGALVACSIISGRVMAMGQIGQLLFHYRRMKQSVKNITQILNKPVDFEEKKSYFYKDRLNGNINIDNVSFTYPKQKKSVLNGINLKINAGEHVGIYGSVGSGKTTLAKLIVNLFDTSDGAIWLDNIDVREIDPFLLRSQVHLMSSDVDLFYGTVIDNIRIVNPRATSEDIIRAANLTGVSEFVKNDPRGFDKIVEEKGKNLSVGQRQAICLTRAMVSNANTFILDEPTAYLDNLRASSAVHQIINHFKNKTFIIITHHVSLFRHVDRLIRIEDGKIVRDGSSEDVIKELAKSAKKFANGLKKND